MIDNFLSSEDKLRSYSSSFYLPNRSEHVHYSHYKLYDKYLLQIYSLLIKKLWMETTGIV